MTPEVRLTLYLHPETAAAVSDYADTLPAPSSMADAANLLIREALQQEGYLP